MAGHWCAGGCQTLIAPGMVLCTSCTTGLAKYVDENAVIVDRYAARGFADMSVYLAAHAKFQRLFPDFQDSDKNDIKEDTT